MSTFFLKDKQPPTVISCPGNIYQAIVGSGANVTWIEPEFTDNVKVVKVTSTSKPGDYFQLGSVLVQYDAYDHAGLSVSCTFTVTLIGKYVYASVIRVLTSL